MSIHRVYEVFGPVIDAILDKYGKYYSLRAKEKTLSLKGEGQEVCFLQQLLPRRGDSYIQDNH
jgi:hypothetical protein